MNTVIFAYDDEVSENQITWRWHPNTYDQKFYPINGPYEECYYDYHAPLQTLFEKNNIPTEWMTVKEALKQSKKFVYLLTFRYLRNSILGDMKYNVFLHLPVGIVKAVNDDKCVLVLNDSHESALYTEDFYSKLVEDLKAAHIDPSKILLLTGNHINKSDESPVKLIFWQFFESAVKLSTEKLDIKFDKKFHNTTDVKKFICLNRIPRETRYYFMYKMYQRNLLHDFRKSLDKVKSLSDIVSYNNNIFLDSIEDKTHFKEMLDSLPWTIDTKDFKINHWDTNLENFSYENCIFIVTETLFQGDTNNIFLTEKTFKPISLKMPFIMIGQPLSLLRLRELGYKTFSKYWDESYDLEFDPLKRMHKICDLVESISKMSTQELITIVKDMQVIIEYNFEILKSKRPEMCVIKSIREKL